MNEKRYLVADVSCGCNIIARGMDIDTALLLIKAYTEKYYMELISLKILEEPKAGVKGKGGAE